MKRELNDNNEFLAIIDATPLVSVDLILKDDRQAVLLGRRVNRPAKGYWFVPGGRIQKNETIENAIKRVSNTELGICLSMADGKLLGVFDHIYEDNFFDVAGINTHYVVLAYVFTMNTRLTLTKDDQHSEMKWWPADALLNSPDVHPNTKAYFTMRAKERGV